MLFINRTLTYEEEIVEKFSTANPLEIASMSVEELSVDNSTGKRTRKKNLKCKKELICISGMMSNVKRCEEQ